MAVQLSLLLLAQTAGSQKTWLAALSLIAGVSLVAGVGALRRARAIGDTATSKVASAAQGYVELFGRAKQLEGSPVASPYTGLPCVWYRYHVERRAANNRWEHVDTRRSDCLFQLDDGTGICIVDPDGAEVLTTRKQTWIRDGYRYTEQLLLAQDLLYAIGDFASRLRSSHELDASADTAALLAEWKQDRDQLRARFDANRDGEVDLREWETARSAAQTEIAQRHRELSLRDGPYMMRKPPDGRLYLLSNLHPADLVRRSARLAWFHLAMLMAAIAGFGWLLAQR